MKNKKFKKFIKPLLVCITLLLTFGICTVFASNNKIKAATPEVDLEHKMYLKVNAGTFQPSSSDPVFDTNFRDFTTRISFTVVDENSEEEVEYQSISGRNETTTRYIYFNRGTTYDPNTSKLIASSVYEQWISNPTITILKTEYYEDYLFNEDVDFTYDNYGIDFLMDNYPGSVERVGYISGKYDFNQGMLESPYITTFPPHYPYDYSLDVSGYLIEPILLTGEQLNEYDYLDVPAGNYYLSTFRNVYLSIESDGTVAKLEFEMYIPGVNDYVKINFVRNGEIYEPFRTTIIFDSSFVKFTSYDFFRRNGIFNKVNPPLEYTPTDLLFGIIDVPVRYLQNLLSFELLGMTFWTIFASFITLGLAIYIVKKL